MSQRSLDQTLDCILQLNRANTSSALGNALLDTLDAYGVQHVLAATFTRAGDGSRRGGVTPLFQKWPAGWLERYFGRGYLHKDPAARRLLAGSPAFLWTDLTECDQDADARLVMDEATEFRLNDGMTISLRAPGGVIAGMSLAGERFELAPVDRARIELLATFTLVRLLALHGQEAPVRLTAREADVLNWAAEGKTDWEIGAILKVSEHTVDKIWRSVRVKLETVNRAHSVARAIRLGLIL